MPIIPLKCPSCGANLQADSDSAILTCSFCGANSVMKDAIVQNYIQNTINITADVVNITDQKELVIEGGVLKKYQGESVDVVIPDNVIEIRKDAFKDLRLRNITIPRSVQYIEENAFQACKTVESITISDGVTEIGEEWFAGCTSLQSVVIPDSVTRIGKRAFSGCSSVVSVLIPDSMTEIGERAFSGCSSLTSITLPKNLTSIGDFAFSDCAALINVELPEKALYNASRVYTIYTIFPNTPILGKWEKEKRCIYCGGETMKKGLFSSVCTRCGCGA